MGVIKEYEFEVRHIIGELNDLINERYYERGTGEAKASTIAKNIKSQFVDLMIKIEKGEPTTWGDIFK